VQSLLRRVLAVVFLVICPLTVIGLPAGCTWLGIELHAFATAPALPQAASGQTVPLWVCRNHGPCRTAYVTELAANAHAIAGFIFSLYCVASVIMIAVLMLLALEAKWAKGSHV
jgi:hypothetical protein